MKKLGKRLLSVMLALLIVISVMPTAFASDENPNLLLGKSYTHDVTSWYDDRANDTDCKFLTDGVKGGTFYDSKYFGGYKTSAEIVFDFDETVEISELQMQFLYDSAAGVSLPPSITVSKKSAADADYVTIYQGEVADRNLVLGSDTETFEVESLKLEIPYMQFVFVKEIEAYATRTGATAHGELKVVEKIENLALGRKYTSKMISSGGKVYNENTTDNNYRLTNGLYGSLSSYNNTAWAGWVSASGVVFDFDLGCLSKIYEVNTRNFNTEMHGIASAGKYEIYASNDGIIWEEIHTNNAVHGLEWLKYQTEEAFTARFVRVIVNQGNSNFIFVDEIEIYGVGGKAVADDPDASVVTNQALGKPYTVTAEGFGATVLPDVSEADMPDAGLSILTDGETDNYVGWDLGDNTSAEVTVQLNLMSSKAINSITTEFTSDNLPSDMTIYLSDTIVNGKANWVRMDSVEVTSASETYTFDNTYKAQYIKLVFTQTESNMGIAEISVTGKGDTTGAVDPTAGLTARLTDMTALDSTTYTTSKVASGYADNGNKLTDGTLNNWVGFNHLAGVTRYVKVDLGAVYEVNAFNAVFDKNNLPSEIYILTSTDGVNWDAMRHYTNDIVASGDSFKANYILGEGVNAQFVMFTFYKASGTTALSEVNVYSEGTKLADGIAKADKGYMIPGDETSDVVDIALLDTDTAMQYVDMVVETGFDGIIFEGNTADEATVLEALDAKATKTIKVDSVSDLSGYSNLEAFDSNSYVSKDFAEAKAKGYGVLIKVKGNIEEHLNYMNSLVEAKAQGKYVYKLFDLTDDLSESFTDEEQAKVFENFKKIIKGILKLSNDAAPVATVVESYAGNWINVAAVDGYEYSVDGENWSKDPLFVNLDPSTEYNVRQRVAETADKEGSVYSALKVTTSSEASAKIPTITKDLASSMTIYAGRPYTLEVEVEDISYGELSYQWYKDDVAIEGATDTVYGIDTPSGTDTGVYKLVVTSTYNGTSAVVNSTPCAVTFSNENINLIKGMAYRHNVKTWHNGTTNEPGNSLTDGVYGTGWGSGNFLDAQQSAAAVLFEFDFPIQFKEIDLYTYALDSGISAPNVQILIKEVLDTDEWLEIYSGTTNSGENLGQHTAYVSDETITATSIKFCFTVPAGGNSMIFVREIELYNEATGYDVLGTLSTDSGVYVPDEPFEEPSEEPSEPSEEPDDPDDVTRENLIAGVQWTTNIPDTQFIYGNGPVKNSAMTKWLTDGDYATDKQYSSTAGIVGFNDTGYLEFDVGENITFRHIALHTATKQSFANDYANYQNVYIEVYKDGAWYKLNTPVNLDYVAQKTYYFTSDTNITASKIRFNITGRKGLYITSFTEFEVFAYAYEGATTPDITLEMVEGTVAVPTTEIVNGDELKVAVNDYVTLEASTTLEGTGGTVTYQWYKNGTAISGATYPLYTIFNATEASAGTYKVVASNNEGTISATSSDEIVVTVEGEVYNYAQGKPYEWKDYQTNVMYTNTNYADTDMKEMTDGKVPSAVSYGVAGYTGTASWKTTNVTVDLGEGGETFHTVKVVFMSTSNSGILLPGTVKATYRDVVGDAWTEIDSWVCADRRMPGIYVATFKSETPITARYVNFDTYNDALTFVSEVMVLGEPPKTPVGYTVSGNLTKSGSEADTTVELIADGEVVASTTIAGKTGAYEFTEVVPGTYTVKVSKTKHADHEYVVEVVDADITQDVELWLYGDVTGDNVINAGDVLQINRKIANMSSVFNQTANMDYRLKVANITKFTLNDDLINAADVLQINRKVANQSSVFDSKIP